MAFCQILMENSSSKGNIKFYVCFESLFMLALNCVVLVLMVVCLIISLSHSFIIMWLMPLNVN